MAESISEQELNQIAGKIRAARRHSLATEHLGIDEVQLSHIEYGAGTDSKQIIFKCLLHWSRNTTEANPREALRNILCKTGFVSKTALDILKKKPVGEYEEPTGIEKQSSPNIEGNIMIIVYCRIYH